MSIHNTFYCGLPALEMENDYIKAIILPSEGSNLISMFDKIKKVELLRKPRTKEEFYKKRVVYGTPILFPPNRIENAEFNFNGKVYKFMMNKPEESNHVHGVLHDKSWNVIEVNNDKNMIKTQFISDDYIDVKNIYCQPFVVEVTFELVDNSLFQTLSIKNKSNNLLPVMLGYHTTFYFSKSSSILKMDVGQLWEFNKRNLPTGVRKESRLKEFFNSGLSLDNLVLDYEYEMTNNKKAMIEHTFSGIQVIYEALSGFNFWAIYNGNGEEDFVSIEPYSCITNAPNLDIAKEITGFDWIEPNEKKIYETLIKVNHI